ncbi:MAG: hypothetical protein JKY92_05435 [Magnetovibrio sp.]|nr:hypothetical protein [Magnetovibrio sp.]
MDWIKTFVALILIGVLGTSPAFAEPLRVGGKALEDVVSLPAGTGSEVFLSSITIYIGNLPIEAAQFDTRAASGRLDRGEIGAYLAFLLSGKPVTGTASTMQTLLLMRLASSGGGYVGAKAKRIKDILEIIHVELERQCNSPPMCSN